jgi:beta-glucanase (GH16 family)
MPDLTFEDDFDGPANSAPDPAKWVYDLGGGGWGNKELETYTNSRENSYLDGNSNLVIAATRNSAGAYFSARLKTLGTFAQIGGIFEARIKLASQAGVWPAFWMMGQDIPQVNWPRCGEIDVLEDFGHNMVRSTVHTPKDAATSYQQGFDLASDTNWHTYRAAVSGEGVTFSRDGYEYGHTPRSYCPPGAWVFGPEGPNNGGLFILLNVAVGGFVGTPPPSTTFPARMLVDYVRVWA